MKLEKTVLTKEQYETMLEEQLDALEANFKVAKDEYIQAIEVHNKYITDKMKFKLNYFLEDDSLIYEKHPKSKIGFAYGKDL